MEKIVQRRKKKRDEQGGRKKRGYNGLGVRWGEEPTCG